jgi:hypothetical protein
MNNCELVQVDGSSHWLIKEGSKQATRLVEECGEGNIPIFCDMLREELVCGREMRRLYKGWHK